MDRILTKFFEWIETRLDKGAWFRRLYVIAATVLTWQVTLWAMRFAEVSTKDGFQIAAIIGAVAAVPGAVVAFGFQQYLNSR
jgi:hypothetical protein